jgi:hypothetical protein
MTKLGAAPVNYATNVGKVRVLLGDVDPENVSQGQGEYKYFSDNELVAVLQMYDHNVKMTAARCLETIASSQVLLLKSWSSDDLTVNGDKIAESLRRIAQQLRDEALIEESSESFELVPFMDEEYDWWN